jgi:hypothetical protein
MLSMGCSGLYTDPPFTAGCGKSAASMARRFMLVFDFDWTLIDDNSDTYVVDQLGAKDLMLSLRAEMPWTQLMVRPEL